MVSFFVLSLFRKRAFWLCAIFALGTVPVAGAHAQSCSMLGKISPSAVPQSRPDAFPKVQAAIAEQASAGSYAAIAIGDSIVMRWPQDSLNRALGMSTLNAGLGGDGTADVIYRLEHTPWRTKHLKRVLLLVGTNNVSMPPCETLQGILVTIREIHKEFPQAELGVVSILPRGANLNSHSALISFVNERLQKLSTQMKFLFIDAHPAFQSGCHDRTPCKLFVTGNLHPTIQGYSLLEEIVRKELRTPVTSTKQSE